MILNNVLYGTAWLQGGKVHHFGPGWNYWLGCHDILNVHRPKRMKLTNFDDLLTFPLALPAGWHLWFLFKYPDNIVNIFIILGNESSWLWWSPVPFFSCTTMRSQQLLSGLPWNLVQTSAVPLGWIAITMLIPSFFFLQCLQHYGLWL